MRQRKSPSKMPKPRRRRGPSRGPIEPTGQLGVSDRRSNTAGRLLPPNDNLRKDPNETHGDRELPFRS